MSSIAKCLLLTLGGTLVGFKLMDKWVEWEKKKKENAEIMKKNEKLIDLWIDAWKKVAEINKTRTPNEHSIAEKES